MKTISLFLIAVILSFHSTVAQDWTFSAIAWGAKPSIDLDSQGIPHFAYTFPGNYLNPFNPSPTIRHGLSKDSHVILEVFSMPGQQAAVLMDEGQDAVFHEVTFERAALTSGVCFYRLTVADFVEIRKLVLVC